MNQFRRTLLLTIAGILGAALSPAGTLANQTFNFTGTCSDCTGTGTGTLVLTGAYVLGNTLTNGDFVSFAYSSNKLSVTILNADLQVNGVFGSLPVGLGAADVTINSNYDFTTSLSGNWDIGIDDFGTNGVWSQPRVNGASTPEPATYGLLGVGLGLCLMAARRRR